GQKPIPQQNAIEPASSDTFVFDPRRGVLVHFSGTHATSAAVANARKARGGTVARELGLEGVWRDASQPVGNCQDMYSMAGWDDRLGLAVLIDDGTGETLGWDGARWHPLGRYPTMPWKPYYT